MSATLLKIASGHSSVVAVVGKGHLQGIKKHWKQPVVVGEFIVFNFSYLQENLFISVI
jgi:pheromone shutdown protein TraB